jgi:hypothetical protein
MTSVDSASIFSARCRRAGAQLHILAPSEIAPGPSSCSLPLVKALGSKHSRGLGTGVSRVGPTGHASSVDAEGS